MHLPTEDRPGSVESAQAVQAPVPASHTDLSDTTTSDDEENVHGFPGDRLLHAWQAQLTSGISPAALMQAGEIGRAHV